MRLAVLLVAFTLVGSAWLDPAAAARPSRTVFATVGWSEWCPPGHVFVDLDTGRFTWTIQLPRPQCVDAGSASIERGVVATGQLELLRGAVGHALEQGLITAECREGRAPANIVVSNASPPYTLVVSGPRQSSSAPNDLGCWTASARNLQRLLGRMFDRQERR